MRAQLILVAAVVAACGDDARLADDGGGAVGDGGSLTLCGDEWVDLRSDRGNCGTCGNACGYDFVCDEGTCTRYLPPCGPLPTGPECCPPCAENETQCYWLQHACLCVDLATSASHCGACGNGCELGQACVDGACRGGGDCIGETCSGDLCPESGVCGEGFLCIEGQCWLRCDPGTTSVCSSGWACHFLGEIDGTGYGVCGVAYSGFSGPVGAPCDPGIVSCNVWTGAECLPVAGGRFASYCLTRCYSNDDQCCHNNPESCLDVVQCSADQACAPSDPGGAHAGCVAVCQSALDAAGVSDLCGACAQGGLTLGYCDRPIPGPAYGFVCYQPTQWLCRVIQDRADCASLDCEWYCNAVGW